MNNGPPLPPKDSYGHPASRGGNGGYGDLGPGGYSGTGQMPPRAPSNDPRPYAPKARPNFSKLGMYEWLAASQRASLMGQWLSDLIKFDTPYLGPKISLMLSQLEFKLSVERQYKAGIEKLVRLYQDDGDRKSRADAEGRRIESNQKIQLLRQALKKYTDLHVDVESNDQGDGQSSRPITVPWDEGC
jgi:hypothetical protein